MKLTVTEKLNYIFYTWFDEMTPRFQVILLLAGVVSFLLAAGLFLQPLLTKEKPMPVQTLTQNGRPNIFFIVVDALSADDMSLFGYSLPTTPRLDKITQTWTVFSNAQSPTTCTIMALPSLNDGRYPYINKFYYYGDQINSQPGWLSIPDALAQKGYQTWWNGYLTPGFYHMDQDFQKNVCQADGNQLDVLSHSRFEGRTLMFGYFPFVPLTLDQLGFVQRAKTDYDICTSIDPLTSLVQKQSPIAPFYIYYHYRGLHGLPYPSGASLGKFLPLSEGFISLEQQIPVYGLYKPQDQPLVDKLRLRYDEAIADQDQKLADFIETLKRQGLYDSAMIIITSDHGQNFENGYTSHCTPLVSIAEANVPLLIKYPYQTEGQRFDFPVSTIDIAPTILDVVGLNYPKNWFDGISLIKQAAQGEPNRIVFTRRYNLNTDLLPMEIAATDGKYRLVKRADKMFLFDLQTDPSEKIDLYDQGGYKQDPEIQTLTQALENYQQRAQFLLDGGAILSAPLLNSTGLNQP